ncbi:MAG: metal-dependent hydrolase [Planctomycetales bacterium]|nr:metal-dependent hydrolase [Planctomycetales bacterium]
MPIELTWLGHASWQIRSGDHTILLDPFLNDNPSAKCKADDLNANYILVSHGHFDHVADAASIANRCDATVVAVYEIADWFAKQHNVANTIGMNTGGGIALPFGHVKMTNAIHSSQLPDGSYGGNPVGFLLTVAGKKLYFACDTALFGDMKLIGNAAIDVAILPIGDHFTMGPADSLEAINLLNPKHVVPTHYNTWPPIEQDEASWAASVEAQTSAKPIVPGVGEPFSV